MSSFKLNKDIFNPTLYKRVLDLWFGGENAQPLDATILNPGVAKKWFQGTTEEKLAFDGVCRDNFAHALEAIGPKEFANPNAEPFLEEIREIAEKSPENDCAKAAWTALSIVLFMDQIPRHIFRTNAGLVQVYNHYDKISLALISTLMSPQSPIVRPDIHPQWRLSPPYRMWFQLPLIHSELIEAHDKLEELITELKEEAEKAKLSEGMMTIIDKSIVAQKEHRDILERFGRYPHRNRALGRQSTEEEKKFLAEGGATFGVVQEE